MNSQHDDNQSAAIEYFSVHEGRGLMGWSVYCRAPGRGAVRMMHGMTVQEANDLVATCQAMEQEVAA